MSESGSGPPSRNSERMVSDFVEPKGEVVCVVICEIPLAIELTETSVVEKPEAVERRVIATHQAPVPPRACCHGVSVLRVRDAVVSHGLRPQSCRLPFDRCQPRLRQDSSLPPHVE